MRAPADIARYCDPEPLTSPVLNVIPVIGQAKGIAEAVVGCDIVTGEELGVWRWLGLLGLMEFRGLRYVNGLSNIRRLRANYSEAYWLRKGGVILDPANYPQSRFPTLQQPNNYTCLPTCAAMAGVADDAVRELEQLAANNVPDQGLGFDQLVPELRGRGWNITEYPDENTGDIIPKMAQELQAGKAVIAGIEQDSPRGNSPHAVLIRSIERTGSGRFDWIVTVNDPATGKVVQIDVQKGIWTNITGGRTSFIAMIK
jgi:hypothetical protein